MQTTFTREEIIADAQAQLEALSTDRKAVVIPQDIVAKSRYVVGKRQRIESLKKNLAKVEAEVDALQKEIGAYLVEHPSGFFLGSTERPDGTGIRRQADFSEVGGEPIVPTGEEAKQINRWVRTASAKHRYKMDKVASK